MSSDEGCHLLGWGVEGENYLLDENGVPATEGLADPSKAFDDPAIIPITQLRNMVCCNSAVELQARYPSYITEVYRMRFLWKCRSAHGQMPMARI